MSNTPRLASLSRTSRGLYRGLSVLVAGIAIAASGCGGGSSEPPNFASVAGYAGSYSASVNRSTTGTATDAILPSGTVSLTAGSDNTLIATLSLTDTTRAKSSRAVITSGTITGTYNSNGTFDFTGRPTEQNTQTGSISIGQQTARLRGQLPSGTSSTTITVVIGSKTTTGTLTLVSAAAATPTPTATASSGSIPAPPSL